MASTKQRYEFIATTYTTFHSFEYTTTCTSEPRYTFQNRVDDTRHHLLALLRYKHEPPFVA
jgi:hypothetical protein